MKKVAALLLIAAAWYFAGIYGQTPLMTVIIGLAVSAVILMVTVCYLTIKTEVFLHKQKDIAFNNI